MMSRRELLVGTLMTAPAYGLLAMAAERRAVARTDRATRAWLAAQDMIARDLAAGRLSPDAWRGEVLRLASEIELPRLLAEIDRALRIPAGRALHSYPVKTGIRFRDESGRRRDLRFASALFEFDADNVITPHAHRHMVSAHMVVEGAFRVRNFDRVRDEDRAIVIRPSVDREIGEGAVSSISDRADNVHWFVPRSRRATTFDIVVSGLEPGRPAFRIDPLDPLAGTVLADGTIRAPITGFEAAAAKYPATL